MLKQYEDKKRAEMKEEPDTRSLHAKESSLIMARVSSERYKKVIKVAVPKYRLNEYYLLYRKENDNLYAYDENDECKPGDWILLRRQKEPLDKGVEHKVERVVYQYGNYIDPLTNRRSYGLYYDDDIERLEKIKISF